MKKYLTSFKLSIQTFFEYRINLLLQILSNLLFFASLIILWIAVYHGKEVVGGFTYNQMISYIFISGIISSYVFYVSVGDEIDFWIRWGFLSTWLVKPINIPIYWFIDDLARRFFNFAMSIIAFFVVFFFIQKNIVSPASFNTFLFVMITIFIAGLLNYLVFYVFSLLAFWMEQTWGVRFVLRSFITIAGGSLIPLSLLPGILGKIILILPFQYMAYFPIQIYLGKINHDQMLTGISIEVVWVVIFYGLASLLYKKGVKKYTAVGG